MYVVMTGDGFRSSQPNLETAAAAVAEQLERAASHREPLDWSITTPRGDEITGAVTEWTHTDPVAAIDQMRAHLIRHHLTVTASRRPTWLIH